MIGLHYIIEYMNWDVCAGNEILGLYYLFRYVYNIL